MYLSIVFRENRNEGTRRIARYNEQLLQRNVLAGEWPIGTLLANEATNAAVTFGCA